MKFLETTEVLTRYLAKELGPPAARRGTAPTRSEELASIARMALCVSKTKLLALSVLFGCSSADFTNVRDSAIGGAASVGAGSAAYGAAGGHASNAGSAASTGGTAGAPIADTFANGGKAAVSSAHAGATNQAGSSGAGMPSANVAGSASLDGTGGRATDGGSAGTPVGTGATSASGRAPSLGGAGGRPSGTPAGGGGMPGAGAGGGGGETLGGCDHQLLANADFEAGPGSPWHESSDWPGIEIVVAASDLGLQKEGVTPYAGNYLAWLGGIPDNSYDHYEVTLTQDIVIPVDAAELTLSGEYLVHSEDATDGAYDEAHLQLTVGDNVGWLAQSWTNQDLAHDWESFTASTTDLDALRGKTVTFVAYSRTDLDGKTSFWLDNLRLKASCGR